MPQDYVLRLVEQIARIMAELLRLPKSERPERLAAICLRETGLPFELVKRSAPETILGLLASGGGTQHVRSVVLAELLLQDAELSEGKGEHDAALIGRAQARALLEHSIDKMTPAEQTIYRSKLEELGNNDLLKAKEG